MTTTYTRPDALPTLSSLKPGAHVCSLYETEEEHRALLTPFLRQGLEQGEKVLYIVDARTAETILSYLRNDGLDVEPLLKRGQLNILTVRESYLREGTFDPDRMIALLRASTEQAVSEGYSALRVTGEMTWALRGLPGSERLIEYEAKLNNFFPASRCLALCQYDRHRFTPDVQLDILATHPMVAVGLELHDNPYYLPPAAFLAKDRPEARLEQWLNNLAARKQMDATLRRVIHDRGERVKELTCLYRSARLLQDHTKPSADLLQELVALLPPAWQYPEITAARIILDGQHYATPNFAETPWKQRAAFEAADGKRGTIEVVYLEEKPDEVEGPFLAEERNLINAVAESLVSYRERQRTEEALRASEETFRAISASAQDAVILLDHAGKISFWNQAAERIFGYPAHETLGRELHGVCVPERFQEASRLGWSRFLQTGQGPVVGKTLELVARRRDGSEFPIELSVAAVPLGGRWNAVGILRDITERRQAQDALIKEKSFTEAVLNSLPGVFYLLDEKAGFLRWNQLFETVSGYSAQEFGRLCAMDLFGGADKTRIAEKIQEVFVEGRATVEAQLMSKDGRQTPFLFTGVQLTLETRRYLVGMGIDITERKTAERKLLQQKIEQQVLLDLIPAMVWYKDTQNRFLRVNRAAAEAARRRIEDIEGKSAHEIYPEEAEGYYRDDLEVIASGQPKLGIIELLQAGSGEKRWIKTDKVPYRDDQGRIVGVLVFAQDITEQKRAEEEHSRLAAIVASSSDAIIGKTLDGIVTSWNQGAVRLYGYRAEDMLGRSIATLFPPDRVDEEQAILKQIARGETVQVYDTVRLRKDGSPAEVSVTVSPIRDAAGRIIGASSIARDVTERRRQEQEQRWLASFPALNPTLIVEVDATGAVTYANPSALKPHPDLATLGAAHPVLQGAVDLLARLKQESGETSIREIQVGERVYLQYCTPVQDYTRLRFYSMDITERKQAEQAVRLAGIYNRSLIEASLDPLVTIGPNGTITDVNAATEAVTGATRAQLIGTDFSNYFVEPEKARAGYQQVFREGFVRDYPLEIRHRDGHGTPVLYNAALYQDEAGQVVGIFAAARDITERKKAEEALRQQTRLLELFFQYTQTSIVFLDRDFNFLRVNDAYAKACQRDVSEFAGHNHFEFYPSDAQAIFEEVVRTGRPYQTVARPFVFPDHPEWGVTYWDWTLTPILDQKGAVEVLVFSLRDVTERKRAEEEIRLSEARLNVAQQVAHIGSWELDLVANRLLWSDEIYRIFERDPKTFGASYETFLDTVHPEDRAMVDRAYTESVRNKTPYELVHRLLMPDGRVKFMLERCETFYDPEGNPLRSVGIVQDITERKQMERHAQRIEQLASMGQLLGGVVHELKNPLFIVTGRLQLLKEKLANREYDGLEPDLRKIGDAAQRMGLIAQRFLTLARPIQPALQRCSVAEIMKGVLDFLANELMQARITVVAEYAADLPPCLSDPAQLHQAFLNLVMNALQAMAKAHGRGTLRVKAELSGVSRQLSAFGERQEESWIEVRIQDDGPGIPPEHRVRLFEPFFTTKPIGEGTGLGLWTVQMIVAGLKGTVAVETKVGLGATFIVRLPVSEELPIQRN